MSAPSSQVQSRSPGLGLNVAPGLLGAALVFWGWQMNWVAGAVLLGCVLEATRWLPARLQWGPEQFIRAWEVTLAAALVAGLGFHFNKEIPSAVLFLLRWLPIVFFPFLFLLACNEHASLPRSILGAPLRRIVGSQAQTSALHPLPESRIEVGYPFFVLCLLAASAANRRDPVFYPAVCLLAGYALWWERPRRARGAWAAGGLILAAGLGFLFHSLMAAAQTRLETHAAQWVYGWLPREYDENEGLTAIGRIGSLKLSSRLLLRVEPELPQHPPKLLRQASYNRFSLGIWFAVDRGFQSIASDAPDTWNLAPGQNAPFSMTISGMLRGGQGLLSLPLGTARISDLPAGGMERNRFGVVRVTRAPEFLHFRPHFRPGINNDSPPNEHDRELPEPEIPALDHVSRELNLTGRSPDQAVGILERFFQRKFAYLPYVAAPAKPTRHSTETALGRFLLHTREGHCEYFATAATLLLRQAGVPARYATGFAVQESGHYGNHYFIRERHAHAWVLYYQNGQWIEFDPTPIDWEEQENARASRLRFVLDWWTLLKFQFAHWQWTYRPGDLLGYAAGLLAVVAGVWTWRRFPRARHSSKEKKPGAARKQVAWPGADSEFYQVEASLRQLGFDRQPGETLGQWLQRVQASGQIDTAPLLNLLTLHLRLRFDQTGLAAEERALLATRAKAWLQTLSAKPRKH